MQIKTAVGYLLLFIRLIKSKYLWVRLTRVQNDTILIEEGGHYIARFTYLTICRSSNPKYNLAKYMEKTYKLFYEVLFNSKTPETTQIS